MPLFHRTDHFLKPALQLRAGFVIRMDLDLESTVHMKSSCGIRLQDNSQLVSEKPPRCDTAVTRCPLLGAQAVSIQTQLSVLLIKLEGALKLKPPTAAIRLFGKYDYESVQIRQF